jgi:hypothetical protein
MPAEPIDRPCRRFFLMGSDDDKPFAKMILFCGGCIEYNLVFVSI